MFPPCRTSVGRWLQEARISRYTEDGTRKRPALTLKGNVTKPTKDQLSQDNDQLLQQMLRSLAALGTFCAVCNKLGSSKKCGGCE